MALNIFESKIFKPQISKAKRKAPKNIYKNSFLNKGVEFINVPYVFHDPSVRSVKACLPTDIKFDYPTADFSLTNPIFNFHKFFHNLDVKAFLQDNSVFSCNGEGSDFIGKDHQYVVTVDSWIIKNNNRQSYSPRALNTEKIITFHGKGLKQES